MEIEKVTEAIEKTVDQSFEKHFKPIMEKECKEAARDAAFNKVKEVVEALRYERAAHGFDRSGLDQKQKLDLAQKFIDAVNGKAQTVESPEKGGILIPDGLHAGIVKVSESFGHVMSKARRFPMGDVQKMTIPKYTAAASTQEWGYIGENQEASESEVSLGSAVLKVETAIKLMRLDNNLLKKASVALADWILAILGESLAYTLDKQGFIGTGQPFVGILEDANVSVITMAATKTGFDDISADDLLEMIYSVRDGALANAGFYFHRTVIRYIDGLKDSNGDYVFKYNNDQKGNFGQKREGLQPVGFIKGYPVYASDVLPAASASAVSTKFGFFGDLSFLALGDSGAMNVARSEHATSGGVNAFAAMQTVLRTTHDHALVIANENGFVVLKTAAE